MLRIILAIAITAGMIGIASAAEPVKKLPGRPKAGEITLTRPATSAKKLQQSSGQSQRASSNALITEFSLPALDAASKEAAYISVKP